MESEKSNAERFLIAYIRIERRMSEIAHESKYVPFGQLLYRCAKENRIIRNHQESLREYNELRNAIVHQRGKEDEIIAQPTDSVTEDIENIASLLEMDDNILHYASSPVKTVKPEDKIVHAFKLMDELGTTKIPVYENGHYYGVVTIEEIARWGLQESHVSVEVSSILASRKNERVIFLKSNSSVQEAVRAFESAMNHGMTLLAILITEHGNTNEKPSGIITVADLPKILKSFS